MENKGIHKDLHAKLSMYITNERWIEKLLAIPEHQARRDHMKIPELIEKATKKNMQIRTELNQHLRFDDLIRDVKSGKIKLKVK